MTSEFNDPKEDVRIETREERVSFSLFGMHCSSCANLIERAVKKLPGVKDANVNYGAEKLRVVYDTGMTDEINRSV
jgi:Cu+-exporting ATPase